jgi:hypothetical protein
VRKGLDFGRNASGLWVPISASERREAATTVQVFAQHELVFPGLPGDFAEFKSLVRSLSRTDALLWCARLNLLMGHPVHDDAMAVQRACVSAFFAPDETERLNNFARERPHGVSVFFRGQLLELFRWISLLCDDQAGDGKTFEDPSVRRSFVRAALLASDVWARRIYPDDLRLDGGLNATRRRVLAALRRSTMETTHGPDPLLALARGVLLGERMRRASAATEELFCQVTGLAIDDYFSVVAYLILLGLGATVANIKNPDRCGMLAVDSMTSSPEPSAPLCEIYFARESQSPDELRKALWGERRDAEENDARVFDLQPLRARPILRVANGRGIIVDPVLFAERASAGLLFTLASGQPSRANFWFAAFGTAFERYVQEIMQRMFPALPGLARRYIPSPMGWDEHGNDVELADGVLFGEDVLVLIETKAVWLKDAVASPNAEPGQYVDHLRRKYGTSDSPRTGDRRIKGFGQLARTIRMLSDGRWRTAAFDMRSAGRVLPVLIVHDVHLDAAVHPHFLAQEFASTLAQTTGSWRDLEVDGLRVAHLATLTVEDIEMLETSSEHLSVVECLKEYVIAVPDRMTSFRNFLLTSRFRPSLRYSAALRAKRDQLLEHCIARLFPGAASFKDVDG